MRNYWNKDILFRVIAILIITFLLGISPLPYKVKEAMLRIGKSEGMGTTTNTADDLVLIARHLPWREGLWEEAGLHAFEAGDIDQAISSFKNAAEAGDLSQQGYLVFGYAYIEKGNLYTAGQILAAGLSIYGQSEDFLVTLAEVQRNMGDFPGLISTLKSLLNLGRFRTSPPLEYAQINFELGLLVAVDNPGSASPYLLQALELDPRLADAGSLAFTIQRALPRENQTYSLMAVGRELASQNRWELAARAFKNATEIQPDYEEGWSFLGEAIQHLDDRSDADALEALEAALSLEPESLSANIFMAMYWMRNGDLDRYYQYLIKAAQIDPENPAILVDLGVATATLGDLENGYKYHLNAIGATYNNPAYLRALVKFCIRFNYHMREIALPTARQAVIADRNNPATLDVMGQLLFSLGDLHNARRFYFRAINRDPEYAPAYFHLGLVYTLMDQPEKAADAYNRAITLAPGTETASMAERFFDHSILP